LYLSTFYIYSIVNVQENRYKSYCMKKINTFATMMHQLYIVILLLKCHLIIDCKIIMFCFQLKSTQNNFLYYMCEHVIGVLPNQKRNGCFCDYEFGSSQCLARIEINMSIAALQERVSCCHPLRQGCKWRGIP
jgi:hypothetical protein